MKWTDLVSPRDATEGGGYEEREEGGSLVSPTHWGQREGERPPGVGNGEGINSSQGRIFPPPRRNDKSPSLAPYSFPPRKKGRMGTLSRIADVPRGSRDSWSRGGAGGHRSREQDPEPLLISLVRGNLVPRTRVTLNVPAIHIKGSPSFYLYKWGREVKGCVLCV